VVHDPDDALRVVLAAQAADNGEGFLHPLVRAQVIDGVVAQNIKDDACPSPQRCSRGDAFLVLEDFKVEEGIVAGFERVDEQAFVNQGFFSRGKAGKHGPQIAFQAPVYVFRLEEEPMGAFTVGGPTEEVAPRNDRDEELEDQTGFADTGRAAKSEGIAFRDVTVLEDEGGVIKKHGEDFTRAAEGERLHLRAVGALLGFGDVILPFGVFIRLRG
jgi:hypothetical protein